MEFSIDLFGLDFLPEVNIFGFWIGRFEDKNSNVKCLLCVHYSEGEWRVEAFWHRFI